MRYRAAMADADPGPKSLLIKLETCYQLVQACFHHKRDILFIDELRAGSDGRWVHEGFFIQGGNGVDGTRRMRR